MFHIPPTNSQLTDENREIAACVKTLEMRLFKVTKIELLAVS